MSSAAGTFQRLCSDPLESMPTNSRRWQTCEWPAAQAGQVPHHFSGITVTGSPAAQPWTPSPMLAIVPLISWPMIAGTVTRASMFPCRTCRSVPHSPV